MLLIYCFHDWLLYPKMTANHFPQFPPEILCFYVVCCDNFQTFQHDSLFERVKMHHQQIICLKWGGHVFKMAHKDIS